MGDPAEQIMAVAISPDARRVAAGGRGSSAAGIVRVWNAKTGEPAWSQTDHSADVLAVGFTPDGTVLATASVDGSTKLRDPKTGDVLHTLTGHEGGATSLAFTADGAVLAAGAANGAAHLWEVATGKPIRKVHKKIPALATVSTDDRVFTSVALTANGQTLATCNSREGNRFDHRIVRIWDTASGAVKRELTSPQMRGRFVAISPDGTTLATNGEGKAIYLWDLRTGEIIHKIPAHPHPPQSAAFSSDGRLLVSGADYRQTKVWDVTTGKVVAALVTFNESKPESNEDDWLAETSDGFYAGSPGIDRFLAWREGGDLKTARDLREKLHHPDRVQAALALEKPNTDSP